MAGKRKSLGQVLYEEMFPDDWPWSHVVEKNKEEYERAAAAVEAEVLRRFESDAKTSLEIVAAGIWRNKDDNTCGLAGAAVAVHAVEKALDRKFEAKAKKAKGKT